VLARVVLGVHGATSAADEVHSGKPCLGIAQAAQSAKQCKKVYAKYTFLFIFILLYYIILLEAAEFCSAVLWA
jgi:hypothetical protein